MRTTIVAAMLALALPASAAQPVTPKLLPKLIGSSAFVIEQAFGSPIRECSHHAARFCSYAIDGKQLGVRYERGVATDVTWFLDTKEGRLTQADLGFGKECVGPTRQPASGGQVWVDCPGGLSIEIQNHERGGTFSIQVAARNLQGF